MARYISPIRFFEYSGIEYHNLSSKEISRINQIIAAEFAIAPKEGIVINDYHYHKSDLLRILDDPNLAENIDYHLLIWQQPSLLNYLELNEIDVYAAWSEWLKLSEDRNFIDFVSTYFAESFDTIMKRYLFQYDFHAAKDWLAFLSFIDEDYHEQSLRSLRVFFDDAVDIFRNTNDEHLEERTAQIAPWADNQWDYLINMLPQSVFYIRENLMDALISFTCNIYENNPELAYGISDRMMKVKHLSSSKTAAISGNHSIFNKKYQSKISQIAIRKHKEKQEANEGKSKWETEFSYMFTPDPPPYTPPTKEKEWFEEEDDDEDNTLIKVIVAIIIGAIVLIFLSLK